ncbi:MAG: extracellular elastinolytic metalloproteinase [Actinomycetota bacterium]|nr:extracellular elastinolytic metalloproteinase [Actinomycetota bacterium]
MRRPNTRHVTAAGAVIALAAALAPAQSATAVGSLAGDIKGQQGNSDTAFDARRAAADLRATKAQTDAVAKILNASGKGARVTWDSRFGTPRSIYGGAGYLTAPSGGAAKDVARAWIADNRAAFGMSAAQVDALTVARDHVLPGTKTHVVTFTQTWNGVEAVQGGRLNVAVTADGKVLSYTGNPSRGDQLTGSFALSPADALGKVASKIAGKAFSPTSDGEQAGFQKFAKGPFAAASYVKKAAFPVKDGVQAAYQVLFIDKLDEAYNVVVDASTGEVLFKKSLVDHESEGTVYENFPGAPKGGQPVIKSFGPTPQSPGGYVDPTGAGLPGPTTLGNNASSYANYSNFLVPADQGPRPVSPTSQFNYVYAQNWQKTKGAAVPPSYALDLDPAATNLFWTHNTIHDEYYDLGFTESAGNFQADGGDPILGLVHAGAASGGAPTYTGRDNAYMLTLPDGIPPWSGMFLWEPINDAFEGPYSDGNFDRSVIQHEYTHGLSNRYVAGGDSLGSFQAGSMGEGWSDWYALNHLYAKGLQNKAVVGEYATGNPTRGIRNWNYDQNPTGFGDIGYDLTGPEVHADGEIWTTTIWDMRKALVAKFGAAKGGEVAARLVTDGMPLTAPDPSFLDARNGILAADLDRNHGDNTDLIWNVFAKRGAGASAVSLTGDDTDPTPAYDNPSAARNGTLVGKVVNASTGQPVKNARVFVGVFEARTTPVARTSDTGGFGLKIVPGSYNVTVQAPGFGAQTFKNVSVTAGATRSLAFTVAPNLASLASGATIVSSSSEDDGLPAKFLLDDTEATVWSTKTGTTPYNNGPDQRVTVKLAKPSTISTIQVSAFKNTTSSRFAALKDFTFQVSDDGVLWKTVKTGGFGYQTPRPTAPDLHYKSFKLASPTNASYVRFFIDSVQGETMEYAQAAELQVFGAVAGIEPVAPPADPDFTDQGTIAAGNPSAGDPTGLQNAFGVTGTEFTTNCGSMPPASQGADAWITKLPSGFGDGTHTVTVVGGESTPAGHDIDLYFLDSQCELNGSAASSAADESTVIPGGTTYVISQLWTGANVPITLTAKDAG